MTSTNSRRRRSAPLPSPWRWTAVFIPALRQALCPSPGLVALLEATANGDLARSVNDGPRMRVPQWRRLRELLKDWLLG